MILRLLIINILLFSFSACSDNTEVSEQLTVTPNEPVDEPGDEVMANMRGQVSGGKGHPGEIIYALHCAECHSLPVSRAPHKSFLEMMAGDMILKSLDEGVMQQMAVELNKQERDTNCRVPCWKYFPGE